LNLNEWIYGLNISISFQLSHYVTCHFCVLNVLILHNCSNE